MRYKVTTNPGFSSINRVGWIVEECMLKDEQDNEYRAVRDKLGVTWPFMDDGLVTADNTERE